MFNTEFQSKGYVGANLVFARQLRGENQVRPYEKYPFEDELV